MGRKAHSMTQQRFGKTIRLFAPLYLRDVADVYRAYETIVARFEDLPRIEPDQGVRAAVAAE